MSNTPQQRSHVAEELRRIVAPWPEVLTKRDIDFHSPEGQLIVACISPRFEAVLDGYPGTYTWRELQEIWRQELTEYPEAKLGLNNVHADVNEEQGHATVHLDMDMNFTANVDLKAFTELKWMRQQDGRWLILRFHGMRGNALNTGFV